MASGSLRGSIFNLSSSFLGSGLLTLPYVMKIMGVIPATLACILSAVTFFLSSKVLMLFASYYSSHSYSSLIQEAFGKATNNIFLMIVIVGFMGSTISYLILITGLILDVFEGSLEQKELMRPYVCAIICLILFPLSLIKKISKFRYVSVLLQFVILAIIVVLIVELPMYLKYSY